METLSQEIHLAKIILAFVVLHTKITYIRHITYEFVWHKNRDPVSKIGNQIISRDYRLSLFLEKVLLKITNVSTKVI